MGILQTDNEEYTLEYGRGDSFGSTFTFKKKDGTPLDITGFSFKLTVNSELDPSDITNQLFSVNGTIIDAPGGEVEFAPSETDTDLTPETYYYDLEVTDASSRKRTTIKAKFVITQDITKG